MFLFIDVIILQIAYPRVTYCTNVNKYTVWTFRAVFLHRLYFPKLLLDGYRGFLLHSAVEKEHSLPLKEGMGTTFAMVKSENN